jgi:surface antigen
MRYFQHRHAQQKAIGIDRGTQRRMALRPAMVAIVAAVSALSIGSALFIPPAAPAMAVTAGQIQSARNRAAASRAREAQLKKQLSGVNSTLANKILELDDLTNNQIPAAEEAASKAQSAAQDASDAATAAGDRLTAAQKDLADLQQQIKQTGKDYNDAHAAVAQVARDSLHGSSAGDAMSILVGSKSTSDFIASMQSSAAVARSESNQANKSANALSLSENREDRLDAIKQRIATLKQQADQQAATAKQAATDADAKQQQLTQLREQGTSERAQLESQKSQLSSAAAQQALQSVTLASQIDSLNQQYQAQQIEAARNAAHYASQGQSAARPSTPSRPSGNTSHSGGTSSGGYTPPAVSGGGSTAGNTYPWGQCTWWACQRRHQLGLWCANYMGNAAQWPGSARAAGRSVSGVPSVHAIVVFQPGQYGAAAYYGHVGVVESVGNGTITFSESNARGLGVISYRTVPSAGLTYIQ